MSKNEIIVAQAKSAIGAVMSQQSAVVVYTDRKGNTNNISAIAAAVVGGAAGAAFRDSMIEAAVVRAANGAFRAAAEIIQKGAPSAYKSAEKMLGCPWQGKVNFMALLRSAARDLAETREAKLREGKELSGAKARAYMVVGALLTFPQFEDAKPTVISFDPTAHADTPLFSDVIENGE